MTRADKQFAHTHTKDCGQSRAGTTQKLFKSKQLPIGKPKAETNSRLQNYIICKSTGQQPQPNSYWHTSKQMGTTSGLPQLLEMTTKQMPATTRQEAVLTLTSNSNANTNPLLNGRRVY